MNNNKKNRFIFSAIIAFCFTIFKIGHTKIGGLLAGGVYSEPHSWAEVFAMAPSFILFFIIMFIIAYLFLYVKWNQ